MIPVIVAKIEVDEAFTVQHSGRVFRRAMGKMHKAMAETAQSFLPRHTAPGAAYRYGYIRRTPGYIKKARSINPSWHPLNLSGELERSLKANDGATGNYLRGKLVIKAKLGGVVGVSDRFLMKAGQLSLSKQQEQIVMRKAEITALTRDEVDKISEVGTQVFASYIKTGRKTKLK